MISHLLRRQVENLVQILAPVGFVHEDGRKDKKLIVHALVEIG